MNPTKIALVDYQEKAPTIVTIESTDWFNTAKKEPGQPGVFEVNPVAEFDTVTDDQETELNCRRYSYFNGKTFGPIASSVQRAFESRFEKSALGHTITAFRGLVEEV
jgi:hypothetical protein